MELFTTRFEFIAKQRLIWIEWSGPFSLAPAEQAISALMLDPRFDPTWHRLYDLRRLTGLRAVPPGMMPLLRTMAAADPPRAKRAVVAHDPVAGYCRVYMELYPPELSQIFDAPAAALKWLLGETPAPLPA